MLVCRFCLHTTSRLLALGRQVNEIHSLSFVSSFKHLKISPDPGDQSLTHPEINQTSKNLKTLAECRSVQATSRCPEAYTPHLTDTLVEQIDLSHSSRVPLVFVTFFRGIFLSATRWGELLRMTKSINTIIVFRCAKETLRFLDKTNSLGETH